MLFFGAGASKGAEGEDGNRSLGDDLKWFSPFRIAGLLISAPHPFNDSPRRTISLQLIFVAYLIQIIISLSRGHR